MVDAAPPSMRRSTRTQFHSRCRASGLHHPPPLLALVNPTAPAQTAPELIAHVVAGARSPAHVLAPSSRFVPYEEILMSTSKRSDRVCDGAVSLVFAALALVGCDAQPRPEASGAPTETEPAGMSEALTPGTRSIIVNSDSSGMQVTRY